MVVWQWLLLEGGYSNVKEIRAALPSLSGMTPRGLWKCLDTLTLNRSIVKKMVAGEHPSYGVTVACVRPKACSLDEGGLS